MRLLAIYVIAACFFQNCESKGKRVDLRFIVVTETSKARYLFSQRYQILVQNEAVYIHFKAFISAATPTKIFK